MCSTKAATAFFFRDLDSLDLGSPFSTLGYTRAAHSKPITSGEDRYQSKALIILAYPTSLCMPHTKGTGNYPKKNKLASGGPMWFLQTDHAFIEICNRKGFKKSIGRYRNGSFTASTMMVELLHVLNIAPGRLWKSYHYCTMHLIFVIIAP